YKKSCERGVRYMDEGEVNECPGLGNVLGNEKVTEGQSERGGHPVIKRPMKQWVLKITEYADRLLEDLETLDWPESIKDMQRNWIGRSEGAEVTFDIDGHDKDFKVFTTRPDTLFGATYTVLAPEHPFIDSIVTEDQREAVDAYVNEMKNKTEIERTDLTKEK